MYLGNVLQHMDNELYQYISQWDADTEIILICDYISAQKRNIMFFSRNYGKGYSQFALEFISTLVILPLIPLMYTHELTGYYLP